MHNFRKKVLCIYFTKIVSGMDWSWQSVVIRRVNHQVGLTVQLFFKRMFSVHTLLLRIAHSKYPLNVYKKSYQSILYLYVNRWQHQIEKNLCRQETKLIFVNVTSTHKWILMSKETSEYWCWKDFHFRFFFALLRGENVVSVL